MDMLLFMTLALASGGSTLSVDFPHGGCRLTVHEDGGGTIAYAALPQQVRIEAGTFDPAEVTARLRSSSFPQAERPIDDGRGSVSLPDASPLRSIADGAMVRRLLQRAWDARLPPASRLDTDAIDLIGRTCGLDQER
ncbi:hypothetical protein [Marilutibacter chinensis]|uniref:Uncharacterized protein n=1 Tax=Marilutibacter chinensis TaxID=2912247 RepID=A0ABS9HWQ2_9GAMM|nr:hypothetical protein [Lysobacter chinensis]MCF7222590.1 hypothetical protein [Lysobacter chinensis]